jgi:purine-binding chemotaxis protein CheW
MRGPQALTSQSHASSLKDRPETEDIGFLCFFLDNKQYGIDLDLVCEIVFPPDLTWVPRMEPHILGVIPIRGAVVTLIDLRQLMGLEPTTWPRSAQIITVELKGEQIGLLVDSVTQVKRLKTSDLEKSPNLCDGQHTEHVLFVSRPTPEELLIIIDLDAILAENLQ